MVDKIKQCAYCGRPLEGIQKDRKFCNRHCYKDFLNKVPFSEVIDKLDDSIAELEDDVKSLYESIDNLGWLIKQVAEIVMKKLKLDKVVRWFKQLKYRLKEF